MTEQVDDKALLEGAFEGGSLEGNWSEGSFEEVKEPDKEDLKPPVKLAIGESYVGMYVDQEQVQSKYLRDGKTVLNAMYKFMGENGEPDVLFGKGNLPFLMRAVEPGQVVKIERVADEMMKSGFSASTFKVLVRK